MLLYYYKKRKQSLKSTNTHFNSSKFMNQSCDKFQTDASVKASAKTNLPKIRLNMNSTQQISIIQGS